MSDIMITSPPKGNKHSTSAKKPTTKKSGASTASAGPGRVTIRVEAKVIRLALSSLNQAAVQDLVEQLGQGKLRTTPVEIEVGDISAIDSADRTRFWTLYLAIRGDGTRPVVLRTGGKSFNQPADWAASGLAVSTDDPDERCRARNVAADVLANAYAPADRNVYLDAIAAKLRNGGFSAGYCDEVKRNIRQRLRELAKDADGESPNADGLGNGQACDFARLFLNDRYSPGGVKAEPESNDNSSPTTPEYNLRHYSESFYRRRVGVWVETTPEDVKLELTSYLQKCAPKRTGTKQIGDVFINLKALCNLRVDHIPPLPFHISDPTRKYLAFQNGLLDLTSLDAGAAPTLLPHDPDWFSTSILPYRYNPKSKCPQFRAFLAQIFNADSKTLRPQVAGDNRIKVVQELFAYSLLPSNPFQTFAIFTGKGGNGKGTLFDAWGKMIGLENISSVPLDAMGKEFGTESLVGKLLNLAGDMNEINAVMEGTLKSWTGEDRVTVYRKHRPPLQIEPTIKFVYGCNNLPWFKDKSDGVWRRLIVVPFTFSALSLATVDARLRKKLASELPAILNWALRGLTRLLKNQRFTQCDVCDKAKAEHRDACSPVKEFIGNQFTLHAEYDGDRKGMKWWATSSAIASLVKNHNEKYGERVIAPHIVCRELAGMNGVSIRRPTTSQGRREYGSIYCGVCIGEPKKILPADLEIMVEKTGLSTSELHLAGEPCAARKCK